MATIGELNIALGGDAKAFNQAINSALSMVQNFGNALAKEGKKVEDFNSRILLSSKQITGISKESQASLNNLRTTLEQVSKTESVYRDGILLTGAAARSHGLAIASQQVELKKVQEQTQKAAKAAKEYEMQLKSVSNSIWLMNNALRQIGISMTAAFTAPIVGAGVVAIKTFTDFERGTVKIQSAAEITRQSAESITQSFIDISKQAPLTVKDLQTAGIAAAQAGIQTEAGITNFALAATKLAKVGGEAFRELSIGEVSDQLAKLSIAFGVAGDDMQEVERVASSLLGVAKDVPGGLSEVIEGMRRVAGFASTAGLSIETTAALIGSLVAAAVPASRAGTELGRVISQMAQNLEPLGQLLGYSSDQIGELKERMDKDLNSVLLETIKRLSLVESGTEQTKIATELFGEVGAKAFLPLLKNTELLEQLLARSTAEFKDGSLLAKEFEVQANSLSGTFQVFSNNVLALAKALGDDLAPYVNLIARVMIEFLQKAVAGWQSLNPIIKTAVLGFAGLLAILGPLILAMNLLVVQPISGFITLVTFANRLKTTLAGLTGISAIVNSQLTYTAAVSKAATLGFTGMSTAMTTAGASALVFAKGLSVALVAMGSMIAVAAVLIASLYVIAKALGFQVKLPTVEAPKPSTKGGAGTTPLGTTGDEEYENRADEEEKAGAAREKALEKELKEKKKLRDKELKAIDRQIKEFEKIRNAEVKALEKAVNEQRDVLDQRKDLWDEEKDTYEEQIDAQKDILESAKKTASEAKKTLTAIKKARQTEINNAEGQAELAEASLEAAQEALKREKILGRDEYDASYRAAEERVKVAENTLLLARENVVKLKRLQDQEIEAQETIVENAEAQVDVQQEALDALQDALDKRTKIVEDEIDIIQDELEVRQDALAEYRESSAEKLDLLREERDAIQEKHNEEIDLLQERLDEIRDQNAALKDIKFDELPDIPGGFEKLEKEINQQIKDLQNLGGVGGFKMTDFQIGFGDEKGLFGMGRLQDVPKALGLMWDQAKKDADEAGVSVWTAFFAQIQENIESVPILGEAAKLVRKLRDGIIEGLKLTPPGIAIMGALMGVEMWQRINEEAEKNGQTVPQYIQTGLTNKFNEIKESIGKTIFDGLFGEGTFTLLQEEATAQGTSIPSLMWDAIKASIEEKWIGFKDAVGKALFGEEDWADLKTQAETRGTSIPQFLWDSFSQSMTEKWVGLKQFLIDTIFGAGTWETLNTESDGKGLSLASALWEGFKRKIEGTAESMKQLIMQWVPDPIKKLLGVTEEAGAEHGKKLEAGLERGASNVSTKGSSLISKFINGIYAERFNLNNAVNYTNSITAGLGNLANSAYTWGQNLGAQLANGIANSKQFVENAINYVNNLISRLWRSYSPPKEGVLKDIDTWGENLTRTFAGGITEGSSAMMKAINDISGLVSDSLTNVELGELAIAPVSGGIGTNISAQAEQASIPALSREAALAEQTNSQQPSVSKNYYIQPGQMIASRGEIRSFVRMLKEYEDFESQR